MSKAIENLPDEEMSERDNALPIVAQAIIDQNGKGTHINVDIHGVGVKEFDTSDEKYDGCKKHVGTSGGDVWKVFTLADWAHDEDGSIGSVELTLFLDRSKP